MLPPYFTKIIYHIIWIMSQQGVPKPFHPPLVKKTNSCRIGRKWVRYELHIHDTMLMFFTKIIFRFTICYFIKYSMQVFLFIAPKSHFSLSERKKGIF